jgi:hypothetical protein
MIGESWGGKRKGKKQKRKSREERTFNNSCIINRNLLAEGGGRERNKRESRNKRTFNNSHSVINRNLLSEPFI